jgi:hypothetical protein
VHGATQRNLRAWGWVAGARSEDRSDARRDGQHYRPRRGNSRRASIPDHPEGMDGAAELAQGSTPSSTWNSAHSPPQQQHADPEDTSLVADTHAPLARLLALHLRRGDFEQHCVLLAGWNSSWQGINEAEGVVDR